MKRFVLISLIAGSLAACAVEPTNQRPDHQVPAARIYIPSMTEAAAGLSEVKISRSTGVFYSLGGMELSINDVVLAELADGEHMSVWLKPGTYTFGIKPKHALNGAAAEATAPIALDVKSGSNYALRVAGSGGRITFRQGN